MKAKMKWISEVETPRWTKTYSKSFQGEITVNKGDTLASLSDKAISLLRWMRVPRSRMVSLTNALIRVLVNKPPRRYMISIKIARVPSQKGLIPQILGDGLVRMLPFSSPARVVTEITIA